MWWRGCGIGGPLLIYFIPPASVESGSTDTPRPGARRRNPCGMPDGMHSECSSRDLRPGRNDLRYGSAVRTSVLDKTAR
ncbi:hypothetical protein DFH07DRAFT_831076 [Mycena maculata]|uniref:Secreted protein n=1 Tax=Mycena maculata TaxID=230809 RepID=A0AAD7N6H6_9AGAR|nr:hypothetical protein DFH07DRAFT_831076 [Mycena maculata]